jgi:Tfp pilus assembly protein PilX
MYLSSLDNKIFFRSQSGFALIVTLLLLLVLMLMAAGIAYMGSTYVDLSNSVSYKPQSINAAETCVDQATDWLKTNDGINWATGVGASI